MPIDDYIYIGKTVLSVWGRVKQWTKQMVTLLLWSCEYTEQTGGLHWVGPLGPGARRGLVKIATDGTNWMKAERLYFIGDTGIRYGGPMDLGGYGGISPWERLNGKLWYLKITQTYSKIHTLDLGLYSAMQFGQWSCIDSYIHPSLVDHRHMKALFI